MPARRSSGGTGGELSPYRTDAGVTILAWVIIAGAAVLLVDRSPEMVYGTLLLALLYLMLSRAGDIGELAAGVFGRAQSIGS